MKKRGQEMLVAKIVMGIAVLNLILLFSALAFNVVRVHFG
jgi:hypothetical protein